MIVILSLLLFTVILDFMVLSPLGAIPMPELHISPDRFGRKRLLLFFYIGFMLGAVLCALATDY